MRSVIQEELFGPEQYTRLCSFCRGEFPRSAEFFPEGRCNDGMASFCRKCFHLRLKLKSSTKKMVTNFTPEDLLEKTCNECEEIKPLREFYMTSHSQDGKTSLCKAITGLIHPLKGSVLFDNIELSKFDISWLRRQICYLPQEVELFNITIKDNIICNLSDAQLKQTNDRILLKTIRVQS